MGLNRRKMEDRRRQAAEKEAAARPGLGVQMFAGNCANCHDWNSKGVQSPYADLLGSRTVNDPNATNLMAILLAGSNAPLPVEQAFMPPFAHGHGDDDSPRWRILSTASSVTGRPKLPPPTSTKRGRRYLRHVAGYHFGHPGYLLCNA
jgi:mono/diheme cytochrome c family protein